MRAFWNAMFLTIYLILKKERKKFVSEADSSSVPMQYMRPDNSISDEQKRRNSRIGLCDSAKMNSLKAKKKSQTLGPFQKIRIIQKDFGGFVAIRMFFHEVHKSKSLHMYLYAPDKISSFILRD